ncbi:MAG: O-antigen ligase family protein [Acidobacteria bacterium]|nr:O-antigen ligase family protein [Acidobacteriota bacterium]
MSAFTRRFRLPDDTPRLVQWLVGWYLVHLLCAPFIATSEGAVAFSLFFSILAIRRGHLRPSWHILYFPLGLYALASTLSAIAAPRSIHVGADMITWLKFLLFPLALMIFREIRGAKEAALGVMLFFGIGTSIWGLWQYFGLGQRDLEHRITGPAVHVMTFSGLILPVALVFAVLWLYDKRNLWLSFGLGVTSLALLLTFTRSVWIGWLAAITLLIVLRRPKLLAWLAPAFVWFLILMPMPLFTRLMSTFDTRQSSNLDRIRMAEAGVEIIRDYPLLGVGPANIKEVYPLYRRPDAPRFRIPHLHNNVIQIWAERGVVALAAYLIFLALFLRECARAWRGEQRKFAEIGVAVCTALTIAGLFEFNFGDTEVLFLMLDVFALVIAFTEKASPAVVNEPAPALVPRPATGP